MKLKSLGATLVLFLLIAFVGLVMQVLTNFRDLKTRFTSEIKISDTVFNADIANTQEKRMKGLSYTEKILPSQAMLFIFDREDKWGIWMKDMNYSLDIIWLSSDKKIVDIEQNISPETYPKVFYPDLEAKYVVEVLSGTVERKNLVLGDEFFFENTP